MIRQLSIAATALLLSLTAVAILPGAVNHAYAQADKARVVLQVSDEDPKKWNLALNNARNIQKDLGKDKVDVEIVVYGPGIGMLNADSKVEPRITAALTDGVKVVACENTMRAKKLTKADMTPGIGYVSSGVVAIMKRQGEGWAYVRP